MENVALASREYEFNDVSIDPLEIDEDPSGLLRGGVGSTIWDAAIVLAKYLERASGLLASTSTTGQQSINVLELGSGTGIVGLAVARMLSAKGMKGSRVVLTDKENVVPLLQRNVEKNSSSGIDIEARVLDWEAVSGIKVNTPADEVAESATATTAIMPGFQDLLALEWDLVILSDAIWVPALYPPLISTINAIITPGNKSQLITAFEKRNFSEEMEFFAMLGKTFRFRDIKPEDQDSNYQSEDIYLFVCQRRVQ